MTTIEQKTKETVSLNLTVSEFAALSQFKLAIQKHGVKTVSGDVLVDIALDEPKAFSTDHLKSMLELKKNEKTGRIALTMEWDGWCAISQTIDRLYMPKKGDALKFRLAAWQLNALVKIG